MLALPCATIVRLAARNQAIAASTDEAAAACMVANASPDSCSGSCGEEWARRECESVVLPEATRDVAAQRNPVETKQIATAHVAAKRVVRSRFRGSAGCFFSSSGIAWSSAASS
eukprot:5053739-Prymnesium_polylepis.1